MYRFLKKIEWGVIRVINILFLFYSLPDYMRVRKNINRNVSFKNKEASKKCYILLGGLSAKAVNLKLLENEDVITVNHFFRTICMIKIKLINKSWPICNSIIFIHFC